MTDDSVLIVCCFVLIILFGGEPDIADALMEWIKK